MRAKKMLPAARHGGDIVGEDLGSICGIRPTQKRHPRITTQPILTTSGTGNRAAYR
jgi:hypothetical protein